MFAVAALIAFILALFKVDVGFSLELLGLALVAAHLAFGGLLPTYWNRAP